MNSPNGVYEVNELSKAFGPKQVLRGFSAKFAAGAVHAMLGPSGCGKTTLLRILSGLETADSGTHSFPAGSQNSWVFQESRLLPWLNLRKNILYVLPAGLEHAKQAELLAPVLELTGLTGQEELEPAQLSGGMARRAALARALAMPSKVLFLDEPFTGLDSALRIQVARDSLALARSRGTTVLWVTHDRQLAQELGDSVTEFSRQA